MAFGLYKSGSVTSAAILDATILADDIAANAVTLAKLATQADDTILGNVAGSTAVPTAMNAAAVRTMIGVEAGSTADQTAAEIRTLVGSATDSNVFTDADHTKLDGIEASATADQTAAEIRTLVGSATDSQVFTDADHTKLDGIEASATADQTAVQIMALLNSDLAGNVQIGNQSDDLLTIGGSLTVTSDLIVSGNTVTVNTATLSVEDPLIILASGNGSADAVDIGMYGLYDTSGSQDLYGGLFRDASDSGKWKLFKDNQAAPTTTVNTSGTGYAVGTFVANLEGDVTGDVAGDVTGALTGDVTGDLTGDVTGNVTGNLTGQVATASQSSITTLSGLTSAGASGVNLAFSGPIAASEGFTGNVTGNCSGTAATVTDGTQASITTLANVATLGATNDTVAMPGTLSVTQGIEGNVTGNLTGVVTHSYAAHASAGALAGTNNLYKCTENAELPSSRTVAGHAIMLHATGAIEISTESTQKIAGSTAAFDMPDGSSAMFISDGTDWMVF
jgi:hypothetical protein